MTELTNEEALALVDVEAALLIRKARALRDQGKGN
jgi:hypothetical protein